MYAEVSRVDKIQTMKIAVVCAVMILLIPGVVGVFPQHTFREVKEVRIYISHMTFNAGKRLIYATSSDSIYVLSSQTLTIIKEVKIINSSVYQIAGIGFNPTTNKLYISVWPNEVIVMNAKDYSIMKRMKVSSLTHKLYGNAEVYVDSRTDMIYVATLNETDENHIVPIYLVINGKEDKIENYIPRGALDFAHNAEWIWETGTRDYMLLVKNLNTGKREYELDTHIPWNSTEWNPRPRMHVSCNHLYIVSGMGRALVYDTDNATLLHRWSHMGNDLSDLTAFDCRHSVAYGLVVGGNITTITYGIRAIDLKSGTKLAELKNITTATTTEPSGIKILGVDPSTSYLYVEVNEYEKPNSSYMVAYSLHPEKKGYEPNTTLLLSIAVVVIASVGIIAYIINRKRIREK